MFTLRDGWNSGALAILLEMSIQEVMHKTGGGIYGQKQILATVLMSDLGLVKYTHDKVTEREHNNGDTNTSLR